MRLAVLVDKISKKEIVFDVSQLSNDEARERVILNWIMNYAETQKTFQASDWAYYSIAITGDLYKQIEGREISAVFEDYNKKYLKEVL